MDVNDVRVLLTQMGIDVSDTREVGTNIHVGISLHPPFPL